MISTSNSNGVTPFYTKKERLHVDLVTRTSWTDAATALIQINKGKASGNKAALWLRAKLQCYLFQLGCFIQRNAGKVVFVGLLVLSTFCVGLKSATLQSNVEKLWVEEGGRLERELAYIRNTVGQGFGSTNQIIIQTPRHQGINVLNQETLLTHLHTVREATQVVVDMFDVSWRLKDLCYSPSVPSFDAHYIDSILENLFPCAIITPLDCFWEGAKLLGPEFPVTIPGLGINVQWTNLNPQLLVKAMKNFGKYLSVFPFDTLEDFMIRAGITTAYQNKPCLDPADEQCPETSPNKHSQKAPDIGGELTGGCYGFATRYMQWPENLIVGGITRNKTGHIVKAEALQTVVQLMAEKEMYEFWQDTYKVHNIDWTPDKAKLVLETWQRKFTETVLKEANNANNTKNHNINAFSSASLTDIMQDFSEASITRLALGYILMLVYACVSLLRWSDAVKSQSGIGIAGVLLVAITVAAGLGFCAIIGISFNASTTQIVPFLALGLGVDDMFLLTHTYGENANVNELSGEQTGQCLKQTGVSVLLTSFSNMCAFFAAAIIPIPALRAFALQAAILVIFNVATMLLIFPAIVSLDLRRRQNNKVDIFCCFNGQNQISPIKFPEGKKDLIYNNMQIHQIVTHALPPDLSHAITVLAPPLTKQPINCWTENSASSVENLTTTNSASTRELIAIKLKQSLKERFTYIFLQAQKGSWSLTWFASHIYAPFLQKTSTKVFTIVLFLITVIASIWGMLSVDDGLDLTDIVPRNTNEYRFLSAQSKYFGFFNMFAITQGNFEYPTNQQLLYEYHEAFTRIDKIIKNDDGGLPDFWLAIFRDWLNGLQKVFDKDWKNGCITQEQWYSNASDEGILAYKLLVQTGRVDNPIDKSLVTKIRLVDSEGIINPKAFYNYLTAWVSNDVLAYSASQANFKPEPKQWIHISQDVDLKIPKSQPLVYTQLPFYLTNMKTTSVITTTIQAIRAICTKFEENGLPNFPTGIPFTYWEQYIGLRFHLSMSLLCVFIAIFLAISLVLLNPWAAFIMVIILALMVIQLFGLMGILGIRLSAVPAVILIVAVGIGVEFTTHFTLGFLTSVGSRNKRTAMALQHMFAPVVHGAMSTLLGVIMLAFSEFDFIVRYFFYVLLALVIIGLFSGLLLLPVILSIAGPPGEVVPHDNSDRIPTPSPEPTPTHQRIQGGRYFNKRCYPGMNSEISLTTITEEPPSFQSSHEIVVEPEVIVETTTITNQPITQISCSNSSKDIDAEDNAINERRALESTSDQNKSPSNLNNSKNTAVTTTRVTATAKVKVEVHTPLPGSAERQLTLKHTRWREGNISSKNDETSI